MSNKALQFGPETWAHSLRGGILGALKINYIHTYIPTYIPTYLPTYLHTYIPTYLHTYMSNGQYSRIKHEEKECREM